MSVHEQFSDDLARYALGELTGEERLALENHLRSCGECRLELDELRGGMGVLAFSVTGPKPPSKSRKRLMEAIAKEPRRREVRLASGRAWWRPLEWAMAAAAMVVVLLLVRQNGEMGRRVVSLEARSTEQQQKLEEAESFVKSLISTDAERFTLVASQTSPQPQGKVIYVRRRGTVVFLASNMPPLPPQKTYELWLIPKSGAPIPAGMFKPDAHGGATILQAPLQAGTEAQTFAITIEPDGGSPAPTSKPIMLGIPG
jgi:anti-sigma-K factor RskA